MLVKYTPALPAEKIIETAEMMQRHIARLENYVNTMNTLQRLEDIELHRKAVDKTCLYRQLKETGACICTDKTFYLKKSSNAKTNLCSSP